MTCREKLKLEHPERVGPQFGGGCRGCPSTIRYLDDPPEEWCKSARCRECWDREIPGTEINISNNVKEHETMTCLEKLKIERPEMVDSKEPGGAKGCPWMYGYLPPNPHCEPEHCEACWNREIPADRKTEPVPKLGIPLDDISESHIKDSGDRTLFDTGAVRDMREGKGRCDLMPLEVVAKCLYKDNDKFDFILYDIRYFMKEHATSYLYNALRNFCELHWGSPYTMFLEVAKHFEEGAKKYGENNWQKGIPVHCYIDSAVRHYLKWLRGDKDEPHDRAFVWNLMCCIWEVDYRPKEDSK